MASFDIAAGITQIGINGNIKKLFQDPNAKKLFSRQFKKTIQDIKVNVTVTLVNAPEIVLAPPSPNKWQASYGADGKLKTGNPPAGNVFQLNFSAVQITGTVSGKSKSGKAPLDIYGEFSLDDNKLTVTGLSVWIDEGGWNKHGLDKFIVNKLLIPFGLKAVNNTLDGILIPQIPKSIAGQTFNDPVAQIVNQNELIVATSLSSSDPVNLDHYTAPSQESLYLQTDATLLNALIKAHVSAKDLSFDEKGSKGGSEFKASGEIMGSLSALAIGLNNSTVNVEPTLEHLTGRGVLSGAGVAVAKTLLCPIGTAIDAMTDPSDWDKIVSQFGIQYSPNPMDIPITLMVKDDESITLSVGELSSRAKVIVKPEWSGQLTGSIMAAAVAAFVDVLDYLFNNVIVNGIIKKYLQDIDIHLTASYSKTIEGVKATINAVPGEALKVMHNNKYVVQGFILSFD